MRIRFGRVTVLALVLVLMAATAAIASTDETGPADLQVAASVLADDSFGIWVDPGNGEGGLWFSAVLGGSSGERGFNMHVLNTTADGWTIDATGTVLTAYDTGADNGCDDFGWNCTTYVDLAGPITIPVSAWHVWGGDDDDGFDGRVTSTATDTPLIAGTPVPINSGTSAAFGNIGLGNPQPQIELNVPATPDTSGYEFYGTVTFTMTIVP